MSDSAPAVFLDRDGTVIVDDDYPRDPSRVRLLPGAATALRACAAHGYRLVVVSNQSGVGRGLVTAAQAAAVHARFVAVLAEHGVVLDDARYCPDAPWAECDCRKPSPRMLLDAAVALDVDLGRSFMVGDRRSDVQAGRRAGCETILLAEGDAAQAPPPEADHVVGDWAAIERVLLGARVR